MSLLARDLDHSRHPNLIQNAVMQLDTTGKMKAEEAQWLVQKGIQGGGLKSGELTVTKVMAKLATKTCDAFGKLGLNSSWRQFLNV